MMMMISIKEREKVKSILKNLKIKMTYQRMVVLNSIFEKSYSHMTVNEIYEITKKYCPQLGMSTIYRTVISFVKAGILRKVDIDDISRYELINVNESVEHPHFICSKCNEVIGLHDDEILNCINAVKEKIKKKYKFEVSSISMNYYGTCKDCNDSIT